MFKPAITSILIFLVLIGYQNCSQVTLSDKVQPSGLSLFTLNVKVCNYEDYDTKVFYGYNRNLTAQDEFYYMDSDGDGLTDEFENAVESKESFGLSSQIRDSNLDGYDDLIVVRFDLDIDDQNNLPICADSNLDSDRDGLNDCTENLVATDYLKPDTDHDGIPDRLEIVHNLNALDTRDASFDLDGDGISNYEEIKLGTPISLSNEKYPGLVLTDSSLEVLIGEGCRIIKFEKIPFNKLLTPNHFVIEILEQNTAGKTILRKVNYFIEAAHMTIGIFNIDMNTDLILEEHSRGEP